MKKSTNRYRIGAALTAGVAALAIGDATIPAAYAATQYGAIAYSSNGSWGRSVNYPSQDAANMTAVAACGYTDCKVLAQFTACGAVASNGRKFQGGVGPTLAAAQADAIAKLGGNGTIDSWGCN